MSKSPTLFASVPTSYAILVIRTILLILSIAGITVFAVSISVYNTHVAPVGALAPPRGSSGVLAVNIVSVMATVISTIWSFIHLGFLARRLRQTHSRGRRRNSNGGLEWSSTGKPVIHPRWVLLADTICWTWFVAMAVLTGMEVSRWQDGKVKAYGFPGTRQVNLKACPTFDSVSGNMDYWCLSEWKKFVDLSSSATSILGTLAGVHSSRVGVSAYEWYLLHRYHRLGGGWCRRASIIQEDNRGDAQNHTKDIELEQT